MKKLAHLAQLAHVAVVAALISVAGCNAPGANTPPSASDSAAVDKVVRDLYTGYTGAATGDQARTALETNGTPPFIDALKAKATACSSKAQAGTPDASCDQDPVVCATGKPTLTTVVVQSVHNGTADAIAVVTPEGKAPINVKVTLAGANGVFKVSAIDCPAGAPAPAPTPAPTPPPPPG